MKQFENTLTFFREDRCPDLGSYFCVDVEGEGGIGNVALGTGRSKTAAIKAARKRIGRLLKDLEKMEREAKREEKQVA